VQEAKKIKWIKDGVASFLCGEGLIYDEDDIAVITDVALVGEHPIYYEAEELNKSVFIDLTGDDALDEIGPVIDLTAE
jgi:hypothetical protein